MPNLTCQSCGLSFFQARGRPAHRCPECRRGTESARYGVQHRRLRSETVDQAVGTACARCGKPIRSVDAVHLDHRDDGDGYLGYSHARCNVSAAATALNKARSEAYRQVRGMVSPSAGLTADHGSGVSGPTVKVRESEAPRCQRTAGEIAAGAAAGDPVRCVCARRNSRCW